MDGGVFQIRIHICHHGLECSDLLLFLSVALCESTIIFDFGFSSSPCQSFSMMYILSDFLLWSLSSHILLQNCFASLAFGCGYDFAAFPSTSCKFFFFCFGMSFFLSVLFDPIPGIFLVFLLSPVPSNSSLRVVYFVLIVLLNCVQ